MKKGIRNRLGAADNDRGEAVLVVVVILSLLLIGLMALAVDLGITYASKRELSVTADGASLAGAREVGIELREQFPPGTACTEAVADALTDEARTAAIAVYNEEVPVRSDGDPTVTVTCAGENFNVTVVDSATHPTTFARLLPASDSGPVTEFNPAARAVSQVSGSPAYTGLRPFAVCEAQAIEALNNPGVTYQTVYDGSSNQDVEDVDCSELPPGNWGLVNFVDKPIGVENCSKEGDSVKKWVCEGYNGPVDSETLLGRTGTPDLSRELEPLVLSGETVTFPVAAEQWAGSGSGANFPVKGFITVQICGFEYQGDRSPTTGPHCPWDAEQADEVLNPELKNVKLKVQWQIVGYATSYQGGSGTECSLSDALCVPSVRLYE